MKLVEKGNCHFLVRPCPHKISEDELKEAMDDKDTETIFDIPTIESQLCTNCLLTLILLSLTDFSPGDRDNGARLTIGFGW